MDLVISKTAKKFIEKAVEKHAKQIAIKIKELTINGHLNDSKKLKGSNYYRIDSGEYRIIYQHHENSLVVVLIGKRNDDEIYNLFKRYIHNH